MAAKVRIIFEKMFWQLKNPFATGDFSPERDQQTMEATQSKKRS